MLRDDCLLLEWFTSRLENGAGESVNGKPTGRDTPNSGHSTSISHVMVCSATATNLYDHLFAVTRKCRGRLIK